MQTLKEILPAVLARLQSPEVLKRSQLTEHWSEIVGPRFAVHTQPRLRPDGVLTVWVDQSVAAFELNQKYKQVILNRVRAKIGEASVKSLRFLVGQLR